MKFEVNRQMMLAAAKGAARVAPSGAHTDVINGILVECNEDTGEIYLTATNHESGIQYKVIGSVSESGTMLINARMLVGMMQLLEGELVSFAADNPGVVTVKGGRCTYNVNCLPAKGYPKPVMPFPEETIHMTGICSLARRTVFAVSKDNSKPAQQCVNIKLRNNAIHAEACDGLRMMLTRDEAGTPDQREFLLPGRALQMLASVSDDSDVFEVGDIGKVIVFVRGDMMFSVRKMATTDFIDTSKLLKGIKPEYVAVTDARQLKEALDVVIVGGESDPVGLELKDNQIIIRRSTDYTQGQIEVQANITKDTPAPGFYYNGAALLKLFHVVSGKVRLEIDAKGVMVIKTRNEVYCQVPQRAPAVKVAKAVKNKSTTTTAAAKAA